MLHGLSLYQLGAVALMALVDVSVHLRIRVARRFGAGHPCLWERGRMDLWGRSDDFCVLVPIFGSVRYLTNGPELARYGDRVVLCTSDGEASAFYEDLRAGAARYGFRIVVSVTTEARPPDRTVRGEPLRDEIIRNAIGLVGAGTVICLDADTVPGDDLRTVVAAFERAGFDVASVRVLPSRRVTLAERLQSIEYEVSMDARHAYPWLTSGAATIARTPAIRRIMATHTLFFSGGDIEVGQLARRMGLKVGHLPVDFYTDVPSTLRAWYRQRARGWCIGGFRLGIVNADVPGVSAPFFVLYQTGAVYLLLPLRWYEIVFHPELLLGVWLVYSVVVLLAFVRRFRPWMLLYPVFSLAQVMCAVPQGIAAYLSYVARTRRVGRIRVRRPVVGAAFELDTEPGNEGAALAEAVPG